MDNDDLVKLLQSLDLTNGLKAERYLRNLQKIQRAEKRLAGEVRLKEIQLKRIDPDASLEDDYICSFCGKGQSKVKKMILGPENVIICNECVDLCNEIIHEDDK